MYFFVIAIIIPANITSWSQFIAHEKGVYHTLNLFLADNVHTVNDFSSNILNPIQDSDKHGNSVPLDLIGGDKGNCLIGEGWVCCM
jgi:hypothetical protein